MKIISTNFLFAPFAKFVALEKRMSYGNNLFSHTVVFLDHDILHGETSTATERKVTSSQDSNTTVLCYTYSCSCMIVAIAIAI